MNPVFRAAYDLQEFVRDRGWPFCLIGGIEERSIERASWWDSGKGVRLFTCSAEDLIVHKVYAARDQDWDDVDRVFSVQRERLNVPQILRELEPLSLLKEDGGIITKLDHMLRKRGLL